MDTYAYVSEDDLAKIALVDQIESDHPPFEHLAKEELRLLAAVGPVVRTPVRTECDKSFHAVHNSGTRSLSVIDLIVMHATQGPSARAAASWFENGASGGSAHIAVDDNICYRTLPNNMIPWGAPGANFHGFHIEQAGFVNWTKVIWSGTHRNTLFRAAYKTAYHCRLFGIEPRFLTVAKLKAGIRNGITTHWECTQAFGGNHTDPGEGWPRFLFMTFVKTFYKMLFKVKAVA